MQIGFGPIGVALPVLNRAIGIGAHQPGVLIGNGEHLKRAAVAGVAAQPVVQRPGGQQHEGQQPPEQPRANDEHNRHRGRQIKAHHRCGKPLWGQRVMRAQLKFVMRVRAVCPMVGHGKSLGSDVSFEKTQDRDQQRKRPRYLRGLFQVDFAMATLSARGLYPSLPALAAAQRCALAAATAGSIPGCQHIRSTGCCGFLSHRRGPSR